LVVQLFLLATAIGPGVAVAADFRLGPVEGLFDVILSYGVAVRVEDRDEQIIAAANGGKGNNPNVDDGNLNYDTGIVSNMLRGGAELALRWGAFGAFVRGTALYDYEQEEQDRARTDLSSNALDVVGFDADLQDHYLSARFLWGGVPLHVRLGDQILNWSETTFLRDGVDVINPVDFVALFQPASLARDVRIPQGMLWAAANATEALAVEGYYQYEWENVVLPPVGSYFSANDLVGEGGLNVAVLGSGRFSDLGTDLDGAFGLPAGTLGFDGGFLQIPGRFTDEPKDGGQFGLSLIGLFPRFAGTKLGLHFIQYHSRLPLIGSLTGDQAAVDATSQDAVDALAQQLTPAYEDTGLTAEEAATRASQTAAQVTLSEYANEAGYFVEYPEDIRMVGLTFNTATLRTGTLVAGEISHHFDFPFQVDLSEVLGAALTPVQFDPSLSESALGQFGADAKIRGFVELDRTQVTLGVTQLLGRRLGAAQTIVGLDVAWIHVHDMPSRNELPLQATAAPNANSWGYRLLGQLEYSSVFGGVNLLPRIGLAHDFRGTTPAPLSSFIEDRVTLNLGLRGEYLNRWNADLSYTTFSGAGSTNLLNDRDFMRLRVSYAF
jgi:hypothetical protein